MPINEIKHIELKVGYGLEITTGYRGEEIAYYLITMCFPGQSGTITVTTVDTLAEAEALVLGMEYATRFMLTGNMQGE